MMATHAIYSLQLIVESFSTGAKLVALATICNDSFKLIVAMASEGVIFAPYHLVWATKAALVAICLIFPAR
jgi:hypothetical protein